MRLQRITVLATMLLTMAAFAHAQSAVEPAAQDKPAWEGRLVEWRNSVEAWRKTTDGLFPLYASYAGLQLVDVHSTTRALDRGGAEANVVMRGFARSAPALTLVKMSAAASTIYLVERVRRRSRTGAMLVMVGLNSAYAIVVAKNYRR